MAKPERSSKYLAFIRGRPCTVTGTEENVVAHHVRCLGGGGMGLKPSDFYCVPLTAEEHSKLHAHGEKSFWARHLQDPVDVIQMNLLCYIAGEFRGKRAVDALKDLAVALGLPPSDP